jgi:hypothetical protein
VAGKLKKKLQNAKRCQRSGMPEDGEPVQEQIPGAGMDRIDLDASVVEHVRMVTSLIEGRKVLRSEILQMLRRAMRQRSFARERRIDYVVRTLKEDPP